MIVPANRYMLLLRYNNYQSTSFIEEHTQTIEENGYTWVLKVGKEITKQKLDRVFEDGGYLFFRAPKASGGVYHIARIIDYKYGNMPEDNTFPEYYYSMENDDRLWQVISLEGTWLKIDMLKPLPHGMEKELRLVSNSKKVSDVVLSTRSSVLYVTTDNEMQIERWCRDEDISL